MTLSFQNYSDFYSGKGALYFNLWSIFFGEVKHFSKWLLTRYTPPMTVNFFIYWEFLLSNWKQESPGWDYLELLIGELFILLGA